MSTWQFYFIFSPPASFLVSLMLLRVRQSFLTGSVDTKQMLMFGSLELVTGFVQSWGAEMGNG